MTRTSLWSVARRWVGVGLRVGALALGGLALAGPDGVAQEGCVSAQCHATLARGKTVHPPIETCDTCHQSVSTPHPRKGVKTFKLVQEPPQLCFTCHDELGKKSHVHPPAREGMCTTCHNPHASDQAKLLVQPMKALCASCHAGQGDAKFPHGPVAAGDCTACHVPHESDIKSLLAKPGDDLCFTCHQDVQTAVKMKNLHPALAGGCTSCHNPHGTAHPKLLSDDGPKACFQCHTAVAERLQKETVVHAAVQDGKACVTCHAPHASDNPRLLLKQERLVCTACHTSVITNAMTTLHGPIREGRCTPCHDPHASQYPRLLVKEVPASAYVPYTGKEFALCFGCHKRDMVQYPDTSFATGFRDGERNLHYLHVNNAQKGRGCRLCHELHGSSLPKLMAENVPFGTWKLPIKFVKTENGGSCAPGCHRPQQYDRRAPARKPAASQGATTPH